jgi:general secretion pathway protein H
MRTSAPGTSEGRARPRRPRSRGFTLLEILVVVAILGIVATVGYATYERDDRGTLEREARRFAGALEYAAQRAQLKRESLGVSAHDGAWRFWRRGDDGRWQPLLGDDALAPRTLPASMRAAAQSYAGHPIAPDAVVPLRASGRNEPYAFTLSTREHEAQVGADPLNRVAIAGPSPLAP